MGLGQVPTPSQSPRGPPTKLRRKLKKKMIDKGKLTNAGPTKILKETRRFVDFPI